MAFQSDDVVEKTEVLVPSGNRSPTQTGKSKSKSKSNLLYNKGLISLLQVDKT